MSHSRWMQAIKQLLSALYCPHPDADIQQLHFEQFIQLKHLLLEEFREEWKWLQGVNDNGKCISKIYAQLVDVNVFRKEDWPKLISFFKPRIIALDSFWDTAKYVFDSLR